MKKIFTLLFATAMLSTAFAQYGQKGQQSKTNDVFASTSNKGNMHDNDKFGGYIFSPRERDMQITQINREYDRKIQSVKNNFFTMRIAKVRQIRALENQRDAEIGDVYAKFNSRKNQYGDFGKNDRKDKKRW